MRFAVTAKTKLQAVLYFFAYQNLFQKFVKQFTNHWYSLINWDVVSSDQRDDIIALTNKMLAIYSADEDMGRNIIHRTFCKFLSTNVNFSILMFNYFKTELFIII